MNLKSACLTLAFCLAALPIHAQSITVEPSAPASYSESKPAYLYFKKIVITRQSKTVYNFDITLQGDLPHAFPASLGADYFVYFDFDDVKVDKPDITDVPGFSDDMSIKLCHRPGAPDFSPSTSTLEIRHKVYELKISTMGLNGNNISFTAECAYFKKDIQTNVIMYACIDQKSPGQKRVYATVSQTRVFDLNTGALLPGKSQEKPADDSDSSPSLGSLIKP